MAFNKLFKKPDISRKRKLIVALIAASVLAAGSSTGVYAWYNMVLESPGNKVTAGRFDITIQVEKVSDNGRTQLAAESGGAYSLDPGSYQVTLTAEGSSQGYCLIKAGDNTTYYTDIIGSGQELTFTLNVQEEEEEYSFSVIWGGLYRNDVGDNLIVDKGTIGEDISEDVTVPTVPLVPAPEETSPEQETDAEPDSESTVESVPEQSPETEPEQPLETTPEQEIILEPDAEPDSEPAVEPVPEQSPETVPEEDIPPAEENMESQISEQLSANEEPLLSVEMP